MTWIAFAAVRPSRKHRLPTLNRGRSWRRNCSHTTARGMDGHIPVTRLIRDPVSRRCCWWDQVGLERAFGQHGSMIMSMTAEAREVNPSGRKAGLRASFGGLFNATRRRSEVLLAAAPRSRVGVGDSLENDRYDRHFSICTQFPHSASARESRCGAAQMPFLVLALAPF